MFSILSWPWPMSFIVLLYQRFVLRRPKIIWNKGLFLFSKSAVKSISRGISKCLALYPGHEHCDNLWEQSITASYLGEELWMEEKLVQLWESQRKDHELYLGLVHTSFSTLMNSSGRQRHQVFQRFELCIVAAQYQGSMGGGKWCHRQQRPEAAQ